MSPPRSAHKSKSYGLVEVGGAVGAVYSATAMKAPGSNNVIQAIRARSGGGVVYALKNSIPIIGKSPSFKAARFGVAAGALAAVGGPVLRKIPLVRKIARMHYKVDKRTTLRVA